MTNSTVSPLLSHASQATEALDESNLTASDLAGKALLEIYNKAFLRGNGLPSAAELKFTRLVKDPDPKNENMALLITFNPASNTEPSGYCHLKFANLEERESVAARAKAFEQAQGTFIHLPMEMLVAIFNKLPNSKQGLDGISRTNTTIWRLFQTDPELGRKRKEAMLASQIHHIPSGPEAETRAADWLQWHTHRAVVLAAMQQREVLRAHGIEDEWPNVAAAESESPYPVFTDHEAPCTVITAVVDKALEDAPNKGSHKLTGPQLVNLLDAFLLKIAEEGETHLTMRKVRRGIDETVLEEEGIHDAVNRLITALPLDLQLQTLRNPQVWKGLSAVRDVQSRHASFHRYIELLNGVQSKDVDEDVKAAGIAAAATGLSDILARGSTEQSLTAIKALLDSAESLTDDGAKATAAQSFTGDLWRNLFIEYRNAGSMPNRQQAVGELGKRLDNLFAECGIPPGTGSSWSGPGPWHDAP